MRNNAITQQRPLFADKPAWRELSTEVHQQVERLLANLCLEIVNSDEEPDKANNTQEQSDEPRTD